MRKESVPKAKEMTIEEILASRGQQYGEFHEHARITQSLKDCMKNSKNWESLTPAMKESLEMQAHKIGRILNGNPNHKDSWDDIEGYCHLVSMKLI